MNTEDKYKEELRSIVRTCIEHNVLELNQILLKCESADPKLVKDILNEELSDSSHLIHSSSIVKRQYIPITQLNLPAPNPSLSQFWFSPESINDLINKIKNRVIRINDPRVLCIGTPSIAEQISEYAYTALLDIDIDVINLFQSLKLKNTESLQYDVIDELPDDLKENFDLVILDPPWYENDINLMLNRALEAAKLNAEIFCTLPGRMTRSGIENFRSALIKKLVIIDHSLVAINQDSILYQVPYFEYMAFKSIPDFKGISWRKGDLIHIIKNSQNKLDLPIGISKKIVKSFFRNAKEFRIFINCNNSLSQGLPPQILDNYNNNISTRAYKQEPDLWTTTKVGLLVSDSSIMESILTYWADGMEKEDVISELINKNGIEKDRSKKLVDDLESYCGLWSKYSSPKVLKKPEDITSFSRKYYSPFAISETDKTIPEVSDNYRPIFSRDRDRIIWSDSLKKLADKTQLFPSRENDTVRRRLTHTLEVMQLSSTIGSSLGLNTDLIEAAALAHDLGHTPFGHAGENAIDKLFKIIHTDLGGFNHYEHGLDTVRFIESPYQDDSMNPFFGLNLSPEILEAILKHTYYHEGNALASVNLQKLSKHRNIIPEGYCHLEGQSVRIADKISYLISDVEDGLSIGAISILDLLDCRLFHRSPLYFNSNIRESALNQFLRQRKWLIKIIMEDVINASTLRISQTKIDNIDSIRRAKSYIISYSEEIDGDVKEVWSKLQTNLLFKNRNVLTANLLAAKIVSELVILFTLIPDLVDSTFRKNHEKLQNSEYLAYYKDKVGRTIILRSEMLSFIPFHLMIGTNYEPYNDISNIPIQNLILSKDYVASLSDFKARSLHNLLLQNTSN